MKRIALLLVAVVMVAGVVAAWAQTATRNEVKLATNNAAESAPKSAKEIRGISPYVDAASEPPPKLIVDDPLPEGLAQGIVWIQWRVENLQKDSPKRKEIIMSSVEVKTRDEAATGAKPVNMKLEVVAIPVSDVDRAKAFYESLGWRLDVDIEGGGVRVVHLTPHQSQASVIFGKGITSAAPGSVKSLTLAVDDVDAARADLIARGVPVSEVFHYTYGPFIDAVENPRVVGRDPEGRSYFSFVSFEDPDGNGWLLQEITTRLPGREWE